MQTICKTAEDALAWIGRHSVYELDASDPDSIYMCGMRAGRAHVCCVPVSIWREEVVSKLQWLHTPSNSLKEGELLWLIEAPTQAPVQTARSSSSSSKTGSRSKSRT